MERTMDRRAFLRNTAVASAAGVLAVGTSRNTRVAEADENTTINSSLVNNGIWDFEIAPDPVSDEEITKTYEADIIVIGAGVAGLTCAAAATEDGADVILFAASSQPVSRGGSNHGIGTKVQERLGIQDYDREHVVGMIKRELARNGYLVDQKHGGSGSTTARPP